jgi:hypothetical protein
MGIHALVVALVAAAGPGPSPAKVDVPLPPPPPMDAGAFKARPPALPAPGKAPRILRVGVPEPKVVGKVSPREVAVVAQALVTEVRKVEGITAVGMSEIREMLTQEYRRQMLGCEVNQECLTEIAGALGVDQLVSSDLVVSGGVSTFTVTRIDMRTTRAVASAQKRLSRRRAGEEVLGAVGEVVANVFRDRQLKAGEVRGVSPQVARWLNPPPLPKWVFYATAGTATALALGAGAYGLASNATVGQYNDLAQAGSEVSGGELQRLQDQAEAQKQHGLALGAAAGLFAVGAGVEAFFTDWHDDRAAVTVGPGGATVRVKF